MKIIVLGASGQIGSVICEGLGDRHDVIGTSRKQSKKNLRFDPFRDEWSALGTPNVLINCIGQVEATNASGFHDIHVKLTELIIKHREGLGSPRIIQVSALGASANHKVEFLRTKGIADNLLLQYSNTAIVRPSIVCTHRTMIIRKMLMLLQISKYTAGFVPIPKGFLKTRIQPVMPQDLVDVIDALCINNAAQNIVNVVGPEQLSFREIMTMMFDTRKKKLRIVEIPDMLSDMLIARGVSTLFPNVINLQLYQLLFEDNVAEIGPTQPILGRLAASTKQFFINEFNYGTH